MRFTTPRILFAMLLLLPSLARAQMHGHDDHDSMTMPTVTRAIAVIHPTEGNTAHGTVSFTREDGGVRVVAQVHGLTPGKHGFHIHEFGDCSAPDGTSAGGHYNPTGHPHAGPEDDMRHAGDLGNLVANGDGEATLTWLDPMIELNGPNSIVGRGVIVHAGEDDLMSQPTGAAGARVGCGVIGVAQGGVE